MIELDGFDSTRGRLVLRPCTARGLEDINFGVDGFHETRELKYVVRAFTRELLMTGLVCVGERVVSLDGTSEGVYNE